MATENPADKYLDLCGLMWADEKSFRIVTPTQTMIVDPRHMTFTLKRTYRMRGDLHRCWRDILNGSTRILSVETLEGKNLFAAVGEQLAKSFREDDDASDATIYFAQQMDGLESVRQDLRVRHAYMQTLKENK